MFFTSRFTDKQFPPSARSMGAWRNFSPEKVDAATMWVRTSEYYRDCALFAGGTSAPGDVAQGKVGNCWLIAAFILVVERDPSIVARAFVSHQSKSCKWKVRLFSGHAGTWQIIVIDDYIPLLVGSRSPVFAHPKTRDGDTTMPIWTMLLEKAFAKWCGGFDKLDGGATAWALAALTGCPVFRLKRYDFADGAWRRLDACERAHNGVCPRLGFRPSNEAFTSEATFLLLCAYCQQGALVGASFGSCDDDDMAVHGGATPSAPRQGSRSHSHGPAELTTVRGLVSGHAYCVLDAFLFEHADGMRGPSRTPKRSIRTPIGSAWPSSWQALSCGCSSCAILGSIPNGAARGRTGPQSGTSTRGRATTADTTAATHLTAVARNRLQTGRRRASSSCDGKTLPAFSISSTCVTRATRQSPRMLSCAPSSRARSLGGHARTSAKRTSRQQYACSGRRRRTRRCTRGSRRRWALACRVLRKRQGWSPARMVRRWSLWCLVVANACSDTRQFRSAFGGLGV